MRGQVLGVDHRTGEGIVAGEDGVRYRFTPEDWADRGEPAIGMRVDFETEHQRALALFPVPGTAPAKVHAPLPARPRTDRDKLVAAALAFFLGTLGIHRFYTGRTGTGILMLVLTCTVVGLILTIPWAFIDMIRYLMMSHEEFEQRYARD
jgi:TM2 domain-containing membrane protein YozV